MAHQLSCRASHTRTMMTVLPTMVRSKSSSVDFSSLAKICVAGSGTCTDTGGKGGWYCQHRLTAISGMVGFRNAVGSASMTNWISPQSQQIAFGRGYILYYYCLLLLYTDKFFFKAVLDMWQSITSIRPGMRHFLPRFLTVNIVM